MVWAWELKDDDRMKRGNFRGRRDCRRRRRIGRGGLRWWRMTMTKSRSDSGDDDRTS